jgi:hypothetical protein
MLFLRDDFAVRLILAYDEQKNPQPAQGISPVHDGLQHSDSISQG